MMLLHLKCGAPNAVEGWVLERHKLDHIYAQSGPLDNSLGQNVIASAQCKNFISI